SAVSVVNRPMRQCARTPRKAGGTVRIAGLGEVRPVGLHGFGEVAIFGAPADPILWIELAKDVFDLRGMIGAGVGGTFGISRMGLVKPIAEGVRFSGLPLRLQPAPGGKGDELIACGIF